MADRYREKPIEVEARQFDPGRDYDEACEIVEWCGGTATDEGCVVPAFTGPVPAAPGDWIIKGPKGSFHVCSPDTFAAVYEPVPEA